MQALLNSVGLGGLVPNRLNVPAATIAANNMRNNARNNNGARRRLNFGAQHPPGNEPEMVEEDIAVAAAPDGVNVAMEAVETVSPPGNSPTVGGRRKSRKANRKSRKASRKAANRKASRKTASRKSRKASRKANRRN